ncbi:TPA: hypothetical protein ACIS09_003136 [Salmonella enterica subsp. enterica serovar Birkenhead]
MIDISKLIRELRVMAEKLPNWRFILLCVVILMIGFPASLAMLLKAIALFR